MTRGNQKVGSRAEVPQHGHQHQANGHMNGNGSHHSSPYQSKNYYHNQQQQQQRQQQQQQPQEHTIHPARQTCVSDAASQTTSLLSSFPGTSAVSPSTKSPSHPLPNASTSASTFNSSSASSSCSFHPNENANEKSPSEAIDYSSSSSSSFPWSWYQKEAKALIWDLSLPTLIIQLSGLLPNVCIASYVGRNYGPVYLDGFTLGNLMGNLCNLSLLQGLYTAADTLSPQAFASGNYKEVGLLAIRGYGASLLVLIPVNVALAFGFQDALLWVGEDPEAAKAAHEWYRIYLLGLPFYALYMVTWKFLSAQEVMRPLVFVAVFNIGVVLTSSFAVLNSISTTVVRNEAAEIDQVGDNYSYPKNAADDNGNGNSGIDGYLGSAWIAVVYQVTQGLILLVYLRIKNNVYTPGTWPGLLWKEAFQWKSFSRYIYLGFGGMLATSEWIYWEVLSLWIGTLGVVPLSVHTVPTQVLMVVFMLPLSVGIALSVRLGATLPRERNGVRKAQRLTIVTYTVGTVVFGAFAVWLYWQRHHVFVLFTNDPEVLAGCEKIWWKVCIFFFNLSVYGINMGISTGLGMQWMFGIVTVIFLWGFSLPSMYYLAILNGGGLDMAWACIYEPYIGMNLVFLYVFTTVDWYQIRKDIRLREGLSDEDDNSAEDDDDAKYRHPEQEKLLSSTQQEQRNEVTSAEWIESGLRTVKQQRQQQHSNGTKTYGSVV